jgi:hypothetical protein
MCRAVLYAAAPPLFTQHQISRCTYEAKLQEQHQYYPPCVIFGPNIQHLSLRLAYRRLSIMASKTRHEVLLLFGAMYRATHLIEWALHTTIAD